MPPNCCNSIILYCKLHTYLRVPMSEMSVTEEKQIDSNIVGACRQCTSLRMVTHSVPDIM